MIKFLEHHEIDKASWDECIDSSPNGLIYAYSWYLDIICPGWGALVYDAYAQVMPLPVRKRFGISYVFAPYYAQQLGVIGSKVDEERVAEFIAHVPPCFKIVDIKLHESNTLSSAEAKVFERKNYLLNIASDYESVAKGYNRNCKRNIKKAITYGLNIGRPMPIDEFAGFVQSNLQEQMQDLDMETIQLLNRVAVACIERNSGEIVTITNKSGEPCAAGLFLYHKKRLIFSVCASSPEGKQNQAMYMLIDQQIRKYAGQFDLLDFSGSEINGIAYFNSTFGAEAVSYLLVHLNKLNWIQRIISGKVE